MITRNDVKNQAILKPRLTKKKKKQSKLKKLINGIRFTSTNRSLP